MLRAVQSTVISCPVAEKAQGGKGTNILNDQAYSYYSPYVAKAASKLAT